MSHDGAVALILKLDSVLATKGCSSGFDIVFHRQADLDAAIEAVRDGSSGWMGNQPVSPNNLLTIHGPSGPVRFMMDEQSRIKLAHQILEHLPETKAVDLMKLVFPQKKP